MARMLRLAAAVIALATLSACRRAPSATTSAAATECAAQCDATNAERCHGAGAKLVEGFVFTATTDPTGAAQKLAPGAGVFRARLFVRSRAGVQERARHVRWSSL